MQHEREEVHGHRGAQDQPHAAGLHQEPIRLHTGRSGQLKWAKRGGGQKNSDSWYETRPRWWWWWWRWWFTSDSLRVFHTVAADNVMIFLAALWEDWGNSILKKKKKKMQIHAKFDLFCRFLCNVAINREVHNTPTCKKCHSLNRFRKRHYRIIHPSGALPFFTSKISDDSLLCNIYFTVDGIMW